MCLCCTTLVELVLFYSSGVFCVQVCGSGVERVCDSVRVCVCDSGSICLVYPLMASDCFAFLPSD